MLSMPRVAMNGGRLKRATSVPLMAPITVPVAMPATMPMPQGRPRLVTKTPVMTADRVMTVPIDRSMPAVMMTNVTPMARMPVTEVARKMPWALLHVAKNGDAMAKKMMRMTNAPSANSLWTASDLKMDPTRVAALCICVLVNSSLGRPTRVASRAS